MHDWNAQSVFGGHAIARDERDYDRAALTHALRAWSPGELPPVASRLHELSIPTLWIAGANDAKYCAEAARGAARSRGEAMIVGGAGHRVPWEAPDALSETIRAFVVRE
jgi:pimeloyl-ACP methyl ester carboxylesterase